MRTDNSGADGGKAPTRAGRLILNQMSLNSHDSDSCQVLGCVVLCAGVSTLAIAHLFTKISRQDGERVSLSRFGRKRCQFV